MIIDKAHCDVYSRNIGETQDCTVYACAIAAQIDYPAMHAYLADPDVAGREKGKGLRSYQYHNALEALGVSLTRLQGPKYEYPQHRVKEHWRRTAHDWVWVPEHYRTTKRLKPDDGTGDYRSTTLAKLLEELPDQGTFLIGTSGHVACYRDGVMHDPGYHARARVQNVYRVEL